jgi:DNA-binding response OmpR family regulator
MRQSGGSRATAISFSLRARAVRFGLEGAYYMAGAETAQRVFVIEDDPMVLMLIEDMLEELGHMVVGTACRLEEALASIKEVDFDLAILDVDLGGKSSHAIASLLRALGRPFIVSTGYSEESLSGDYLGAPVIEKPFVIEAVDDAVRRVGLGRNDGT